MEQRLGRGGKWKAITLVFVNANENLNRVVTVGTEMKEQMGELL